jgi:hypothetical protein
MIGHSDPAFTAKVYAHEFDAATQEFASKAALAAAYAGVFD